MVSGRASSRSVSPVGAQSTTIDVEVAGFGQPAQLQQGDDLLGAGQHVEFLGLHLGHPAGGEHADQVAADVRPALLEPAAGVHLGRPEPFDAGDRGGVGADGDAEHIGNGVRRVGGDQQGAGAAGGAGNRGGRRDGRLADPALAGVQGDPHPASTRLRSSFSAVSRMTRSALRRSTPIIGTARSTASV